ncbi:MAG: trypsin-like peptidase domain-containing protein [Clostridiales bacterium]|nr:trypsin-like peptidase domain-containing protein [Clostridiales bacterium]
MNNNEEQINSGEKENSSRGANKTVWLVVAVMTVICIAVGVLSSVLTAYFMRRGAVLPPINIDITEQDTAAVVKARKPAVTEVICGGLRGSGVNMRYEKGKVYVLTNAHVLGLENGGETPIGDVVVRFYNEEEGYKAEVVGYSALYDIALVSVEHGEVYIIDTPEIFNRTLTYSEGDRTVAIGNAMGLGISAYDGIISKSSDIITSGEKKVPVMRTTSAINAGMSGGALFDMKGCFLGLGTYRMSSTDTSDSHEPSKDVEDTGFVTPVSIVYDIYRQIFAFGNGGEIGGFPVMLYYGSTNYTSLGGMTVTVTGSKPGTFTAEMRRGKLVVSSVDTVSPIPGMQVGDVIYKIGGTELYPDGKDPFDFCRIVGELLRYRYLASEGEKFTLGLLRGDMPVTVEIEGYFGYVR